MMAIDFLRMNFSATETDDSDFSISGSRPEVSNFKNKLKKHSSPEATPKIRIGPQPGNS